MPKSQFELGLSVPIFLALFFFADVGSRFLTYDHVSFRAWEAMKRRGIPELGGQFEPEKSYTSGHSYGDLASLGNTPAMRQYRAETFTTDAWGFRNPRHFAGRRYAAVLLGSSFSAGSSLRDEETLSARLEEQLGQGVYNAAPAEWADENRLNEILDRLGMTSGTVIVEQIGSDPALFAGSSKPRASDIGSEDLLALVGRRYEGSSRALAWVRGFMRDSPLKLALFTAFKALENDAVLPNSFRRAVVSTELMNGDPILFLREHVVQSWPRTAPDGTIASWESLASRLARRGLGLLVVLVPSQYGVYGPLAKETGRSPGSESVAYLGELERRLRQRGLAVLNLTDTFQASAREGLARHDYIYWRDDTHWNAAGVSLAAQEIALRLRRPASQPGSIAASPGARAHPAKSQRRVSSQSIASDGQSLAVE